MGRYDSPLECRGIVQADAHALTTPENLLPEGNISQQLGWKLAPRGLSSWVPRQPITDQPSFFLLLPIDQGSNPSESYAFTRTLALQQGGDRGGKALPGSQIMLSKVSHPGGKGQNPTIHHPPDCPLTPQAHLVSTTIPGAAPTELTGEVPAQMVLGKTEVHRLQDTSKERRWAG